MELSYHQLNETRAAQQNAMATVTGSHNFAADLFGRQFVSNRKFPT
jgi:hypothetical protein